MTSTRGRPTALTEAQFRLVKARKANQPGVETMLFDTGGAKPSKVNIKPYLFANDAYCSIQHSTEKEKLVTHVLLPGTKGDGMMKREINRLIVKHGPNKRTIKAHFRKRFYIFKDMARFDRIYNQAKIQSQMQLLQHAPGDDVSGLSSTVNNLADAVASIETRNETAEAETTALRQEMNGVFGMFSDVKKIFASQAQTQEAVARRLDGHDKVLGDHGSHLKQHDDHLKKHDDEVDDLRERLKTVEKNQETQEQISWERRENAAAAAKKFSFSTPFKKPGFDAPESEVPGPAKMTKPSTVAAVPHIQNATGMHPMQSHQFAYTFRNGQGLNHIPHTGNPASISNGFHNSPGPQEENILGTVLSPKRFLGAGNFAAVSLWSDEYGEQFAVKTPKNPVTKENFSEIMREGKILQQLSALDGFENAHLVSFHHFWMQDGMPRIAMGLCAKSLGDMIEKNEPLSDRLQEDVLDTILFALEWLHSHGWVHLDIKPDNILVSSNRYDPLFMLADFGRAVNVHCDRSQVKHGDRRYLAPGWNPSTDLTKYDMYALGVTMEEIAGAKIPREIDAVVKSSHRLIPYLLDPNPERRPNASQALEY
ncbi:MAG: hypothetical protein SGILL_007865 [Bacillariaceae sp.]